MSLVKTPRAGHLKSFLFKSLAKFCYQKVKNKLEAEREKYLNRITIILKEILISQKGD